MHYRVVFREGSHWHLFDSLGMHGVFEREVWPTIQGINPDFELHLLDVRPQSDGVNCGLWALWAV